FRPELMFGLGPFDCVVLGEGERPLLELVARLRAGATLKGVTGTAERGADGQCLTMRQQALTRTELRDAIFQTPYERMPYAAYWERLEKACRVGALPSKAAREASLAEIRSVRLITLNYCPMGCTFCSSTNFLHEAQGSVASIARLDAEECVQMLQRIVGAHPGVRTIIFQDDIFVFTKDKRVLPLCEAIVAAKASGALAVAGTRSLEVSVRDSVLRSCHGGRSGAEAVHRLRAPTGCRNGRRVGSARQDPAARSGGARGDPADRARVRGVAPRAAEPRGASALARALADLDSVLAADHGRARPGRRQRAGPEARARATAAAAGGGRGRCRSRDRLRPRRAVRTWR